MIKAVLFDLDDTLYREQDFVEQAFRNVAAAMAEYVAERGGGEEERISGSLFGQMIRLMEEEGRGEIFNRLCDRYGVDIPAGEFVRIYRETIPVLSLYPDGEEFLAWLEDRGVKTGLITDGNAPVQHRKIRALGLDGRLDVVLASCDLGLAKPDPEVYRYCLGKLGVAPKEAVYIGDNPLKDFIGARQIGMKTVRIVRPEGMHMCRKAQEGYEADLTVHLLTELEEWMEADRTPKAL